MTENQDGSSQKQILKVTGIVGGAQIISILISIVRMKVIAILLGPSGVGISGLYSSTLDIVHNATSLGLDFSAVRDVAEASSTGDERRISYTITVLRRWMWITGLAGLLLLVLFRKQFSLYAFKDEAHAIDFLMLSAIPLLSAISSGQLALLRGVRRIGDMASANVLGAAAGFCITLPLYWLWGIKGIVPAMLLSSLANLGLSWYFARKLKIPSIQISVRETISSGAGMIRLGFFTVISGLAMSGALYLVRIIIARKVGLEGVGQFQAAWNLSATYVGLVLGSMGADYYPRLVMVNNDNTQISRLVNEQTEVALLLAGPLIIGMLCFVDIVIKIFYSKMFWQSGDILLWQLAGELLKVISWPMGFVFLAKSKGLLFIIADLVWDVVLLGTIWLLIDRMGIAITGIAFLVGYFAYAIITFILCNRMCGFLWSRKNVKNIVVFSALIVLALLSARNHYPFFGRLGSAALFLGSIIYSCVEFSKTINFREAIGKLLHRIGRRKK